MEIKVKRAYEEVTPADGMRILVDRLWPRGISKETLQIDHWAKAISPSNELRKWYNHNPEKWESFQSLYFAELDSNSQEVEKILKILHNEDIVTFVYSSKESAINNAFALKQYMEQKLVEVYHNPSIYKQHYRARWGDMDFNAHMSNTAYLDMAGDVRMLFFEDHGFSMREFENLHLGPVVMKDEIEYKREIRLLEHIEVHQLLAGISQDGSRMRVRNLFYNADGKQAASVTSTVGWMDLRTRKLASPPDKLHKVILEMVKTEDFETLPSSAK